MCRALPLPGLCFLNLVLHAAPAPWEAGSNLARGLEADLGPEAPEGRSPCPGCEDPDSLQLLQRHAKGQLQRYGAKSEERRGNQTEDLQLARNLTDGWLQAGHGQVQLQHRGGASKPTSDQHWDDIERADELLVSIAQAIYGPRLNWAIFFLALQIFGLVSAFVCGINRCRGGKVFGCMGSALFCLFIFLLLLFTTIVSLMYLSGALIKELIEHFDLAFIGTNVTLESVRFNPFSGHFRATDIRIYNPSKYATPLLLQANDLSFDLGVTSMMLSCGKRAVADHVSLNGVNITYERSWTSSNLADIMNYLNSASTTDVMVTIHEVGVTDIHAKATTTMLAAVGVGMHVNDIHFRDFTRELGSMGVAGVVRVVLTQLLKSVLQAYDGT